MGLAASRQEAFWEACGFGNIERARHFLKEGDIDVNWVSYANDCCPIHAASQGKPEIVQLLLEHKCNVNVRDNRDNLPLHHAAMKGHADIVQTLLNAGCEIDAQEKNGWTALHNAAYWCHPEVVRVLLKNGCNVHVQNKDERMALHECARSQSSDDKKLGEIAQVLIDAGSDINSQSSDWGEADLTGLMYASFHNHPDVASAFISAGCELNSVGTTFWTALHWAADRGNDELVYILLDAGIDPTIRDMRGETAVDRAQTDDIREFISTAVDLHKELNKVKQPVIRPAVQLRKQEEPFKPKCDANFKSQSFLPKDWKPSNPVNVKNLINEKKSRLAAMTSQNYRTELAKRTGTEVIKDDVVKKTSENIDLKNSSKDIANEKEEVSDSKCDAEKSSMLNDDGVSSEKESVDKTELEEDDINKEAEAADEGNVEPNQGSSSDNVAEVEGQIKDLEVNKDVEESDKCNDTKDKENYSSRHSQNGIATKTTLINAENDDCERECAGDTESQKELDGENSLLNDQTDEMQTLTANDKGDVSNIENNSDNKMGLDSEISMADITEHSSAGSDGNTRETVEKAEELDISEKQIKVEQS